ncbi:MAG: S24 family peptidase [Rikenellaceae bacterium]|nr:S24 family peptidase [Rikenellaceae bacterium]
MTGETRPRIPHSAAAGELAGISDGVMPHNCEQVPVIPMFKKYDFTIIVYGDSMLPHFHSGDEIACLTVRERSFIQWGRVHVLDTYQGVVVKRIFEREDGILCRSDNAEYPEFTVSGDDIYSIAVVIGLIRRC